MYIDTRSDEGLRRSGFAGSSLGQLPGEDQKSRSAILKALQLNPAGGYVKGSAARKQLDDAINSEPICSALQLAQQLLNGQGPLEKLFRYRLDPFTQATLLRILAEKAKACLQQERETLRQKEREHEEARKERDALNRRLCESLRKEELLVQRLCSKVGEDSPDCRNPRESIRVTREELRKKGSPCP